MTKSVRLFALAMAAMLMGLGTYANEQNGKATEKARQAVADAAPDDWQTYAQSAELCIRKKVNLTEAKEWLERSIEIRETTYNLAIMGDYYRLNNLPEKALEYYVKSLRMGLEQDITYQDAVTQEKIMQVRKDLLKSS